MRWEDRKCLFFLSLPFFFFCIRALRNFFGQEGHRPPGRKMPVHLWMRALFLCDGGFCGKRYKFNVTVASLQNTRQAC